MLAAIKHVADDNFVFLQHSTLVHGRLCTTQFNCCSMQHKSLHYCSRAMASNSPELNPIDYKVYLVIQQRMACESSRLKKSSSNWLKSGKAVIQHLILNMRYSCFGVLPGSAESVKWCGTIKHHSLTVYFLSKISAKNCQNQSIYEEIIASQMWDVFQTQCMRIFRIDPQLYLCSAVEHFTY